MGRFREQSRRGISEIKEQGRGAVEKGSDMTSKAEQINDILESIELVDNEDIQGVSEASHNYQGSFDTAFKTRIETQGEEVAETGENIKDENIAELGRVRGGISKLEMAKGVSDIGSDVAERARGRLEKSAAEYETIINDADVTVKETQRAIKDLKENLSGVFG